MLFVHFKVTMMNHQANNNNIIIIIIIIITMRDYILIAVQFWDLKANRRVNSSEVLKNFSAFIFRDKQQFRHEDKGTTVLRNIS